MKINRGKAWLAVVVSLLILVADPRPVFAEVDCTEPGVVCVNGNLVGDVTWTPSVIYVIKDADLTVLPGSNLNIQAGTIVKLDAGRSLIIQGTLNVNGSTGSPVYLTSVRDDIGGDTNHDLTPPAVGNWRRLHFQSGSTGSLSYLELRYGGNNNYGLGMLHTEAGTIVTLSHGKLVNSEHCAISSDPSNEVTLNNMTPADFTGNHFNGLCLRSGSITANTAWDETETAYILIDTITVPAGITLTWAPGVVIKPRSVDTEVTVDGSLNAGGSSASRIYVTSLNDNSVGGDSYNASDLPGPSDWSRVIFRGTGQGTLAYVEMRYGGSDLYQYGMLHTESSTHVTVDHGRFLNSGHCAISSSSADEITLNNTNTADFSGNRYNSLCLRGGALAGDTTWSKTQIAYILVDDLTVPAGLTLTWLPGIVIKPGASGIEVFVDGTLNAVGTSQNRITVTSLNDDSAGGDSNGNNNPPASGDWGRLSFRAGSTGILQHTLIQYGGNAAADWAAVEASGGSVSVSYSKLTQNVRGFSASGTGTNATITLSEISASSEYGVLNAGTGGWVEATDNWWGSASGPSDPSGTDGEYNNGSGDRVNDYVHYWPWATSTEPPGGFDKVSPADGAPDQPINPVLNWGDSAGVSSYEYCYSSAPGCSSWIKTGPPSQVTLHGLSYSTTYYWKVRAINPYGVIYANGSAASEWSFTTQPPPPPGTFHKSSPANHAVDQPLSLTLKWTESEGADGYAYCLDTVDPCQNWSAPVTATQVTVSGLEEDRTYYWQVRAINGNGSTYADGSTTATWSFKTISPMVTLSVTPAETRIPLGQDFDVTIEVHAVLRAVEQVNAYLNFDPSVLSVVSVTPGSMLSTITENSFSNSTGQVNFSARASGEPPTGKFSLATIRFHPLEGLVNTQLVFAATSNALYGGQPVLMQTIGGRVWVGFDQQIFLPLMLYAGR